MIKVKKSGIVYRNSKPHLKSLHAYFPSLVLLRDGDILVSFTIGSAFDSVDCHPVYSRSSDGGKTWVFEGDLPVIKRDFISSTCRISLCADGEIIGFGAYFIRNSDEQELLNPETNGFVPTELFLIRSKDKGFIWTKPEIIIPPIKGHPFEICSPVVALTSNEWLIPTSTWKGWNGEDPIGMKAIVLRSYDKGKTWSEYSIVMDGSNKEIVYWEQKLIKIANEQLLSVCWTHNLKDKKDMEIHYAISQDRAKTFSAPQSTGLKGQTCTPIYLEDNKILSLYRRTDKPGLWANISHLDGNKWINDEEVPLWGEHFSQLTRKQRNIVKEMNILKFGLPTIIKLNNKEIFAAFWCVEECVAIIRWFHIEIT